MAASKQQNTKGKSTESSFSGKKAEPTESSVSDSESNNVGNDSSTESNISPPVPVPTVKKQYIGELSGTRIYLAEDEKFWETTARVILFPVNQGEMNQLSVYLLQFTEHAQVPENYIAKLQDEKFLYSDSGTNYKIIPYQLKEIQKESMNRDNSRFLVVAIFPNDESNDDFIARTFNSIPAEIREKFSKELTDLAILLTPLFSGFEEKKTAAILAALKKELTSSPGSGILKEVLFIANDSKYKEITFSYFNQKPPKLEGDVVSEKDMLNIENEAFALADILSLREMTPPISVAIMGGWGSGKSSVMRLMQKRMRGIRSAGRSDVQTWFDKSKANEDKLSPFVGHIYQIELNAWDYAKSNLWASLMYKIFYCLNDQMAKEKMLADFLAEKANVNPENGAGFLLESPLWEALSFNEKDLKTLLSDENYAGLKKHLDDFHTKEDVRDYLWKSLESSRAEIIEKWINTRAEVNIVKIELSKRREEIDAHVDKRFTELARRSYLMTPLKNKFFALFGEFGNQLFKKLNEPAKPGQKTEEFDLKEIFRIPAGSKFRLNKTEILGFTLFAALSFLLPFMLQLTLKEDVIAFLLSGFSVFFGYMRTALKSKKMIFNCLEDYHAQLEKVKLEIEPEKESIREQEYEKQRAMVESKEGDDKSTKTFATLEKHLAELTATEKKQRELVGITADYLTLTDFLKSRLGEGGYEKELGLMHQVKKDLEHLTEGLRDNKTVFPRGPARIVLFIDDLDRCPPQRVVEVFEATQLLLRTELFIVVLAIDVRYIVKSLEKYYDKILVRGGRPSALDYIEKIIQIPYRVRSIDPDNLGNYLKWQMPLENSNGIEKVKPDIKPDGTAEDPSQVKVVQPQTELKPELMEATLKEIRFTPEEFVSWEQCCREVKDLTPREIKRLVNVAKILKLVWFREGASPEKDVKNVIFLLLALSERFPDLMRDILNEMIDNLFNLAEKDQQPMVQAIKNFTPLKATNFQLAELKVLHQIVTSTTLIPGGFSVSKMGLKSLDLVRSFCFVGDVGYDPEDENIPESKNNNGSKTIHVAK